MVHTFLVIHFPFHYGVFFSRVSLVRDGIYRINGLIMCPPFSYANVSQPLRIVQMTMVWILCIQTLYYVCVRPSWPGWIRSIHRTYQKWVCLGKPNGLEMPASEGTKLSQTLGVVYFYGITLLKSTFYPFKKFFFFFFIISFAPLLKITVPLCTPLLI
jgi:hypothetical protein